MVPTGSEVAPPSTLAEPVAGPQPAETGRAKLAELEYMHTAQLATLAEQADLRSETSFRPGNMILIWQLAQGCHCGRGLEKAMDQMEVERGEAAAAASGKV